MKVSNKYPTYLKLRDWYSFLNRVMKRKTEYNLSRVPGINLNLLPTSLSTLRKTKLWQNFGD